MNIHQNGYNITDLADISFPNKDKVTYGDSYFDTSGKEHPLDTILTAEVEFLSKQYLDYVF